MNNDCGVYRIKNVETGKLYIGSSKTIARRFYCHRWDLRRGSHHSPLLQRAWKKYGEAAFTFEIIVICSENNLLFYEQAAMDLYRAYDPAFGMNISSIAGRSCVEWTKERRAASSAQRMGKRVFDNPVARANLLAAVHRGDKHHMFGKSHSEDSRKRISKNRKGITAWNKGIPSLTKGVKRDPVARASIAAGVRSGKNAKLTMAKANEIRQRHLQNERVVSIAARYDVSKHVVYQIINNKAWQQEVA